MVATNDDLLKELKNIKKILKGGSYTQDLIDKDVDA